MISGGSNYGLNERITLNSTPSKSYKIDTLIKPSAYILAGDSGGGVGHGLAVREGIMGGYCAPYLRHNNGWNAVFCDMHVEYLNRDYHEVTSGPPWRYP